MRRCLRAHFRFHETRSWNAIEQRRSAIISEGKLSTTRRFRKRVPPRRRSERFDCWNVTVTLPPVSSSPFRSSSCLSSIIERISKDSRLPLSFRRNTMETVIEFVNCVRDPLGYKSRYAICFLTGTLNDLKAYLAWGGFIPWASRSFSNCRILILAMSNSCFTFHRCVSHIGSLHLWYLRISCASYTAPRNVNDFPILFETDAIVMIIKVVQICDLYWYKKLWFITWYEL